MNEPRHRIRRLRRARGMSQKELAVAVGLKHTAVNKWEAGTNEGWRLRLDRLCRALRCEPEEILFGRQALTERGYNVGLQFDDLTAKQQELIFSLLDALSKPAEAEIASQ